MPLCRTAYPPFSPAIVTRQGSSRRRCGKAGHRALKEDERRAIATAIVEHLKLCGWKFQMTPIEVGHGTGKGA
jgi:hypothetical protein